MIELIGAFVKATLLFTFIFILVVLLMFLGVVITDISNSKINEALSTCEKHNLVDTISYTSFTCKDGSTFKYKESK